MLETRLLLADDHAVLVEGLRKLLESNYTIVGTATDGRELVTSALKLQPDVVVLDVGMPLLNGIEATRRIRVGLPSTRVIVLTQQANSAYVREAFRAGANAYVLKQSASSELLKAISETLEGRYYVSPMLSTEGLSAFGSRLNPSEMFGGSLTARQREVLQLLAEGKSAKEIGGVLGISVKTVEFHKAAIMDELGLRTAAELTRYALECGLVN